MKRTFRFDHEPNKGSEVMPQLCPLHFFSRQHHTPHIAREIAEYLDEGQLAAMSIDHNTLNIRPGSLKCLKSRMSHRLFRSPGLRQEPSKVIPLGESSVTYCATVDHGRAVLTKESPSIDHSYLVLYSLDSREASMDPIARHCLDDRAVDEEEDIYRHVKSSESLVMVMWIDARVETSKSFRVVLFSTKDLSPVWSSEGFCRFIFTLLPDSDFRSLLAMPMTGSALIWRSFKNKKIEFSKMLQLDEATEYPMGKDEKWDFSCLRTNGLFLVQLDSSDTVEVWSWTHSQRIVTYQSAADPIHGEPILALVPGHRNISRTRTSALLAKAAGRTIHDDELVIDFELATAEARIDHCSSPSVQPIGTGSKLDHKEEKIFRIWRQRKVHIILTNSAKRKRISLRGGLDIRLRCQYLMDSKEQEYEKSHLHVWQEGADNTACLPIIDRVVQYSFLTVRNIVVVLEYEGNLEGVIMVYDT